MDFVPNDEPLVTIFESRTHLATIEAEVVQSLLESAGISSWIARENVIQQPVGNVILTVLQSQAEDAKALLLDAERAAEEGEA